MFEFKKCFTTNSSIILAGKDISQPGYKNWEDYVAKKPIIADRIFSINTNSGLITLTVKKDLEEIDVNMDINMNVLFSILYSVHQLNPELLKLIGKFLQ